MIKAAVLHEVGDVRIENVEMAEIKEDNDVSIRIRKVGICGSDVHFYREGKIGWFKVEKPLILGHECAGEVVEIGKGVKTIEVGDKVAVEPGIGCGICNFCHEGRYNLCPEEKFLGTPPQDGALIEYLVWPEDFVFKLPDNIPLEAGALCEPLSVALQALKIAKPRCGSTVYILGAGPIGLALLQASLAYGAASVYVTDLYPLRVQKAVEMGATEAINATEVDPVKAILDLTRGAGVDVVYEAAGSIATQKQSFKSVKTGGTVVLVGMGTETENVVPLLDVVLREYQVKGVMRYSNVYSEAVSLTASRKVNLLPMITHRFSLEKTKEALDLMKSKNKVIKAMIEL